MKFLEDSKGDFRVNYFMYLLNIYITYFRMQKKSVITTSKHDRGNELFLLSMYFCLGGQEGQVSCAALIM